MTPEQIKKLIQQTVQNVFSTRIVGDTPTDANQLVPKKYVDSKLTLFSGLVLSDGTAGTPFPSGWSSARTGAGQGKYRVTHNIGNSNYVVVASPDQATIIPFVLVENDNSFDIYTTVPNATATDADFYFILMKS